MFAQNYHTPPEAVLDMTLQNIVMYNAVLPSYVSDKDKRISGDDPRNREAIDRMLGL